MPNPAKIICFSVDWGTAKFIWAPSLDYDIRILLRYTTCDYGVYPVVRGQQYNIVFSRMILIYKYLLSLLYLF